jgi:hypothetical protein
MARMHILPMQKHAHFPAKQQRLFDPAQHQATVRLTLTACLLERLRWKLTKRGKMRCGKFALMPEAAGKGTCQAEIANRRARHCGSAVVPDFGIMELSTDLPDGFPRCRQPHGVVFDVFGRWVRERLDKAALRESYSTSTISR